MTKNTRQTKEYRLFKIFNIVKQQINAFLLRPFLAETPVIRQRQLRDEAKSGGIQPAQIRVTKCRYC
jgi:hypothetical protein